MIRPRSSKYDVIVVGAGNAAMTAAISARQNGARVLVLEKATQAERGGNSAYSGGLFRFAYQGVEDLMPLRPNMPAKEWQKVQAGRYDADIFFNDWMRVCRSQADPELAKVTIKESYPTIRWMTNLGVTWTWTELWSVLTEDSLKFTPGTVLEVDGKGMALMESLYAAADRLGVGISYQSKMIGFLQDERGGVNGVRVRTPTSTEDAPAGAVILASGGFEANAEMRARYLGPNWDQVKVRGTKHNTGEVMRMAIDIGARPVGHWQGCHATPIDGNAPQMGERRFTDKSNRLSYPFTIMVDTMGRRFVDEGEDVGGLTYAKTGQTILNQPANLAYQIFDAKTIHLKEHRYSTGTPLVANTIEELAKKLSLPVEGFKQTVKEFNVAVQPGEFNAAIKDGKRTQGIVPPKSNWALPIDTPPYTAYSASCGITFTYGGIQIDTQGRVITTEGDPIPGLYATGEIAGNFFYHNYPGGAGLMRGAVFGRLGGANATAQAIRKTAHPRSK